MAQGIRIADETIRAARRLLARREQAGQAARAAAGNGHAAEYEARLDGLVAGAEGALAELWAAVIDGIPA